MLQWMNRHKKIVSKKTTVRLGLLLMVVFCWLFLPIQPTSAQSIAEKSSELNQGVTIIQQPLGLPATDIRLIIARIIRAALGLLGIVLLVLFLYGGFLYMTSGGNEEQVASAKKILINATIGLAIILTAYSIVLFVMHILGVEAGTGETSDVISAPSEQNFSGSGALGTVIKDHYPARDQKDVPRNAKILITFRKPINPESFILNSNNSKDSKGNPIYGDCVNSGVSMKWETDCDQIKPGAGYLTILRADTKDPIRGAAIMASYESDKLYTIVIRPYDILGSATEKVSYLVRIGNSITLNDAANSNQTLFGKASAGHDFYEWQFTTNTALDVNAPVVTSVFPVDGSMEAKNSAIQITFSEAMDPTGIQGSFAIDGDHYTLSGNTIFLQSTKSSLPIGIFHLTNGYRTLEFTPSKECGDNACGGKVYCMPVCDLPGANCSADGYQLLVRAAQVFSANSFEAIPFSGAMDLAGNALDGNGDGKVQSATRSGLVFSEQKQPDNYSWRFNLTDKVDLTAPFIKKVTPGVDAGYVEPNADWSMLFSKRMLVDSLYNIAIQESPAPIEQLCRVPQTSFGLDGSTQVNMKHCAFLNKERHYYFPTIDSSVIDVHFNCFYPGKGPLGLDQATKSSLTCDESGQNCCAVSANGESFCCNGAAGSTDQKTCLAALRANSP